MASCEYRPGALAIAGSNPAGPIFLLSGVILLLDSVARDRRRGTVTLEWNGMELSPVLRFLGRSHVLMENSPRRCEAESLV